jgi:hypothetical protein
MLQNGQDIVHNTFFLPPSELPPHAPTSRGRASQEQVLFVPAWFAYTECEVTRFFNVKYIMPGSVLDVEMATLDKQSKGIAIHK